MNTSQFVNMKREQDISNPFGASCISAAPFCYRAEQTNKQKKMLSVNSKFPLRGKLSSAWHLYAWMEMSG